MGKHRISSGSTVYSRHIGRVGALAVALGVGVTLSATPVIARADEAGASNASDSPAADTGNTPDSVASESNPTDAAAGGDPGDGSADGPIAVAAEQPEGGTGTTTVTVGDSPSVTISSSGGAHSAGEPDADDEDGATPVADPSETATPESTPALPDPQQPDSAGSTPVPIASGAKTEGGVPVPSAADRSSPADAPAPMLERSSTAGGSSSVETSDVGAMAVTAPPIVLPPPSVSIVTPAVDPVSAFVTLPVRLIGFALDLVSAALAPLMGSGPALPADTPVMWAVLAFVRRQFFNSTPSLSPTGQLVDPTTGQLYGNIGGVDPDGDPLVYSVIAGPAHGTVIVDAAGGYLYTPAEGYTGADGFTVAVSDVGNHVHGLAGLFDPYGGDTVVATIGLTAIAVDGGDANIPPVVGQPGYRVTGVNGRTGAVSGTVAVSDPDGDTLTYSLAAAVDPEFGSVTVDSSTGAWTFTPTGQTRLSAWSDPAVAPVSFAVAATDGDSAVTVTVTAAIDPAARYTLESIFGGEQESWGNQGLAVGPDGRMYLTTYMLDDTAGEVVVLNADGTYAATIALPTEESHPFVTAYDVTVGPDGRVFVSGESAETHEDIANEEGRGFVAVVDPDDGYAISVLAYTSEPASAVTTDGAGRILVANWNDDTITVLNADGSVASLIESDELLEGDDSGVAGIAVGPDGLVYLTKPALGLLKVVDAEGDTVRVVGIGGRPWAVTVAANGLAYVTDFDSARVTVVDAAGDVARTVTLPEGARPSDVTVGGDGLIYVSYLSSESEGAIAIVTAVPVDDLEDSVIGDPITGSPGSHTDSVGPAVAGDVVYQTVTGVDPVSGLSRTAIVVVGGSGPTTPVYAPGEPVGALLVNADGVGYQAVSFFDDDEGVDRSGVLVVTPNGPSTFTGLFDGAPAGPVVLGTGGRAYQVLYSQGGEADAYTTTLVEITSAGVTAHTVDGYPGNLMSHATSGPVVATDGAVYLTTTTSNGADFTTTVAVLNASGFVVHDVPGFASGQVSIAPNGTVYQMIGNGEMNSDTGELTTSTALTVVTAAGIVVLPETVVGLPLSSPVIAGDTGYHLVHEFGADGAPGTSTLVSVTATGLRVVLAGLPGLPTASDGSAIVPVVGADGSTYLTLTGQSPSGPDSTSHLTFVLAVSPAGALRGFATVGEPVGSVVLGADGAVYQTTYDSTAESTTVTVITPAGETRHEFAGYPGDPEATTPIRVVVGPDGTAYQVIGHRDPATGEYTSTVAVFTADGLVAAPSFDGRPSGTVAFGPDGRGYLTIGRFDIAGQTALTTVVAVDGSGQSQFAGTVRGVPAGSVAFDADGAAYLTVELDEGYGVATAVHALEVPEIEIALAARAQGIGVMSVLSGNVHVIDDAYLQSFNAADPTGRFAYTLYMRGLRGQTTDQTPLTGAQLDTWLAANREYLSQVGQVGFARDAQGRLVYRNTSAQDVLVVYGPNPNTIAPLRAVLVRAGQSHTLPSTLEGAFAASQRLGQENFDAVVYRGAVATPVPTPTPKTEPVVKAPTIDVEGMRAQDLIARVPESTRDREAIRIQIIDTNPYDGRITPETTRMVVYLSGMLGQKDGNWLELAASGLGAVNVANGQIPKEVSEQIRNFKNQYKVQGGIMLVGFSKGGMIAQNYAHRGDFKKDVKAVVTFASPIVEPPNFGHPAIHILDHRDSVWKLLNQGSDKRENEQVARIYELTNDGGHTAANYTELAEWFELDQSFRAVKNAMSGFRGTRLVENLRRY